MNQKAKEVWKCIIGFENYEISDRGRIRRVAKKTTLNKNKKKPTLSQRIMKQRWNKSCKTYFLDLINNDKKRKTVYPHKEVAKAFCSNDNAATLTMIIHLDNNSKNNYATNLEWVSPSDHMSFQFKVGNKDNFKVWKTRKKKYKNGFKEEVSIQNLKLQQG